MKLVAIKSNEKHFTLNIKLLGITLFDRKWSQDGNRLELRVIGIPIFIPTRYLKGTKIQTAYEWYLHVKNVGIVSKRKALELRVEEIEKAKIIASGLWDPLWYVQAYHHKFNRQEALDYWYHTGWKKGENPSPLIDSSRYTEHTSWQNPILAYLSQSNFLSPTGCNSYKSGDEKARAEEYWEERQGRDVKSAVYTCITNGYDDLREIASYGYVNPDWDYVCFTDDQEFVSLKRVGIWQIRPLVFTASDNTRVNRWHKLHPHELLPEYEESIYIDPNINIRSSFLFDEVKKRGINFLLPRHARNLCIFSEYKDVLEAELDDPVLINAEMEMIKKSGMPENYGFCENNVLYRRHNDRDVIAMMDEWWDVLVKYSKRDQLSLVWILWKHHLSIRDITFENVRFLTDDFLLFSHKRKA